MYHSELTIFNIKLFETPPLQTNRKIENAKIEVKKNSITEKNITLVITDTNEFSYNWLGTYEIEYSDNWRRTKIEKEIMDGELVLSRDENNQISIAFDLSNIYDELVPGTYRIVKEVFDESHGYVDIFSNKFEIVK